MKLRVSIIFLLTCLLARATDVIYSVQNFSLVPANVRSIEVYPLTPGVFGTNIISADRIVLTTDSVGRATNTDVVMPGCYKVVFRGVYTDRVFTNCFDADVLTNSQVYAANYVVGAVYMVTGSAYLKAESEARYLNISSSNTLRGADTNFFVQNSNLLAQAVSGGGGGSGDSTNALNDVVQAIVPSLHTNKIVNTNGSVNLNRLLTFPGKLGNGSTNTIKIGLLGDSVIVDAATGSKADGFATNMLRKFGRAAGGMVDNSPYLYFTTNGVGTYGTNGVWMRDHPTLTNGSVVTYLANIANGPSNEVSQVWSSRLLIIASGTGTLTIQVSTNGGSYANFATYTPPASGAGATQFNLTMNYHNFRVLGPATGTNDLIVGGLWEGGTNKVMFIPAFARSGNSVEQFTSIPTNISYPVLTALKPDITLFEAKDDAATFTAAIPLIERMWTNCIPTNDLVYIGTTPSQTGDTNYAIPQNTVMRSMAITYGRPYWDGYSVFSSWAEANALGLVVDSDHINPRGGMLLGGLLWGDLERNFKLADLIPGSTNGFNNLSTNLSNTGTFSSQDTTYSGSTISRIAALGDNQSSLWLGVSGNGPSGSNVVLTAYTAGDNNYQPIVYLGGQGGLYFRSGPNNGSTNWGALWPSGGWSFMDMARHSDRTTDPGENNVRVGGTVTSQGTNLSSSVAANAANIAAKLNTTNPVAIVTGTAQFQTVLTNSGKGIGLMIDSDTTPGLSLVGGDWIAGTGSRFSGSGAGLTAIPPTALTTGTFSGAFTFQPSATNNIKFSTSGLSASNGVGSFVLSGGVATSTSSTGTNVIGPNGITNSGNIFIPGAVNRNSAEFGTFGLQSFAVNNGWLSDNGFYNNNWIARSNGYATFLRFTGSLGLELFGSTGLVAPGATFTPIERFKVLPTGAFGLGGDIQMSSVNLTNATIQGSALGHVTIVNTALTNWSTFDTNGITSSNNVGVGRLNGPSLQFPTNTWNIGFFTNGMANGDVRFGGSNGLPVCATMSAGTITIQKVTLAP